jgi:hypothetical protein
MLRRTVSSAAATACSVVAVDSPGVGGMDVMEMVPLLEDG